MIIVEGTDGLGKTTLCQTLLKQLPTHVYSHFTRLPEGFDYYWGYKERISPNIVQDRFHMSEVCYARMRNEDTKLDPETYRLVDATLRRAGAYTVVLIGSDSLITKRGIQKDEMYDTSQILKANSYFISMVDGGHLEDFYRPDVDFVINLTERYPYVDERTVAHVLEGYHRRRAAISDICSRQPTSLKAFDIL